MATGHVFDGGTEWWRHAVVYHILPASFQDSNGDGIGDLPGIIARLDYLESLGVDAVWLSPIFRSPMLDAGYDIEDFTAVDPIFGTLADFDRLRQALDDRGIRLLLDFVPNHTSMRHPWFVESAESRTSAKRNWYVWADPDADGGPPNNWLSRFGGSAWEFDPRTGQYYYHAFLREQPDLNWREPEVKSAMSDVMRFWLNRGVDGFRVDASGVLIEDELLRDDPIDFAAGTETPPPERQRRVFTDARPESLECISLLRSVIDQWPGALLAGEADTASDRIPAFYGDADRPALHLPLNFRLHDTHWDAISLAATIDDYLNLVPATGWPNWDLGSHDKPRIASRVGAKQAGLAAMLHLTLPGTAFLYAGDEMGMPSMPIPPEAVRDPFAKLVPGYGLGRDPHRTPMRWSSSAQAGFTTGNPWLPVGPNIEELNVEVQRADPGSLLNLYRRLIELRKRHPGLRAPCLEPLRSAKEVLAFRRRPTVGLPVLVILNLGDEPRQVPILNTGRVLLSTNVNRGEEQADSVLSLGAREGVILEEVSTDR